MHERFRSSVIRTSVGDCEFYPGLFEQPRQKCLRKLMQVIGEVLPENELRPAGDDQGDEEE